MRYKIGTTEADIQAILWDKKRLRSRIENNSTPVPITGCWLWTSKVGHNGYGKLSMRGKTPAAHRISYMAFRGDIPAGLVIDHLCRVLCCVNPDHLEAVTQRENVLRGIGPAAIYAKSQVCKEGHRLDGPNLIIRTDGARRCRTCEQAREKARPHRKRVRRA